MRVTGWLNRIEDSMYFTIGGLLGAAGVALLGWAVVEFVRVAAGGDVVQAVLGVLDSLLLVLMLVEIMHTVRISIGSQSLVIEPFLIVGLIAAIRRILVVTAEQANPSAEHVVEFQMAMLELGILTAMILALVWAIYGVRKFSQESPNIAPEEAAAGVPASHRAAEQP